MPMRHTHGAQDTSFKEIPLLLADSGECQNPYNHNPYCVAILIGFLEILIGQFRDFDCRNYDCRDFDCRDFDIDPYFFGVLF